MIGYTERNSFQLANVVAGGEATGQVPVGKTLTNLELKLAFGAGGGFTKSQIELLKLRANGKVVFEGTGDQIDKINKYRGLPADASFLDVAFSDLTGLDDIDRHIGALDTSVGIKMLTAEVQIAPGAVQPKLTARVHERAPQRLADGSVHPFAGLVAKQLRYTYNVSAGGELLVGLPFGKSTGAIIKRVHVFNANMTNALVKEDGIEIHKSSKAENEYNQIKHGRVPQAGMYTLDFMVGGSVRDAFDTTKAETVDWLFTFSAADNGYIIVEYLDRLGNL